MMPSIYAMTIKYLKMQVPAIAYDGPDVPPDQPSAESFKIAESLVLLEFVADIFPASGLLPSDPIERAKVRFFIDTAAVQFYGPFFDFLTKDGSAGAILPALRNINSLLTPGARFAVGDRYTIADAALAPILWRLELAFKHCYGACTVEEGKSVLDAYEGEELSKLRRYF